MNGSMDEVRNPGPGAIKPSRLNFNFQVLSIFEAPVFSR